MANSLADVCRAASDFATKRVGKDTRTLAVLLVAACAAVFPLDITQLASALVGCIAYALA
eukprot:CAMPEP_0198512650 /NCGR_PEP_ID=MMETSP1462-20131121/15582_1 /TAXON_ID=1333877 /ORGANISM="Brandtodinium nutriculum, Strain RCC3387" /LENGTH=59 /DNA_ID=CAMNT_0044242059 /DNA_START=89 /DNA_END=264 /DNA_ORIENTATION=-